MLGRALKCAKGNGTCIGEKRLCSKNIRYRVILPSLVNVSDIESPKIFKLMGQKKEWNTASAEANAHFKVQIWSGFKSFSLCFVHYFHYSFPKKIWYVSLLFLCGV
jgi:hypothetical protein